MDEKLEDLQSKMQDVTKWMEGAEERYVEEQRKYVSILGSHLILQPFDTFQPHTGLAADFLCCRVAGMKN